MTGQVENDSPSASDDLRCRWMLVGGCADLLFLTALAVAAWCVPDRIAEDWPIAFAIGLGVVAVVGYYVLTEVRLRRGPGVAARREVNDELVRRGGPAMVMSAAIAVPYAVSSNSGWVVLTLIVAGVLCLLDWLAYKNPHSGRARPGGGGEPVDCDGPLRELARGRGVEDLDIVVDAARPGAAAAYAPTRPKPTFLLTRELVDLLSPAELLAVFAHELAHHQLGHAGKTVWAGMLRKFVSVAAVAAVLVYVRGGGPSEAEAVRIAPTLLLGWSVAYLLAGTLVWAHQRSQERRAHRLAMDMTGDPDSLGSAVRKIAEHNGCARENESLRGVLSVIERYTAERPQRSGANLP